MKTFFEDTLRIESMDRGQFTRVQRIQGKSDIYDLNITLDINTQVYPIEQDKV